MKFEEWVAKTYGANYKECTDKLHIDWLQKVWDAATKAEREACAKLVYPGDKRPCACDICDCGNYGDAQSVARWDEANWAYKAIRARSNSGD